MRWKRTLTTVGVHAEGEYAKVVTGGVVDVPGRTMFDKMQWLERHDDGLRKFLLYEPRGAAVHSANVVPSTLESSPFAGCRDLSSKALKAIGLSSGGLSTRGLFPKQWAKFPAARNQMLEKQIAILSFQDKRAEAERVYREAFDPFWTNEESGADGSVTTVTFEEKDGKTTLVLSELYPTKEALDAAGTGAQEAMIETFGQLDELLASLAATASRP